MVIAELRFRLKPLLKVVENHRLVLSEITPSEPYEKKFLVSFFVGIEPMIFLR